MDQNILENGRRDLFVVTKHWRKYHGYDETKECLRLSLKRLQLDYVDLWYVTDGCGFIDLFRCW